MVPFRVNFGEQVPPHYGRHASAHHNHNTFLTLQPTMSALVVTADGEVSNIALKSHTIDEAFEEYYKVLFPRSRDLEMQDIYARRGEVVGTRECVSLFYDSGRNFKGQGRNKYFEGKLAPFLVQCWRCGPRSL